MEFTQGQIVLAPYRYKEKSKAIITKEKYFAVVCSYCSPHSFFSDTLHNIQ